jgi:hypothetical protein
LHEGPFGDVYLATVSDVQSRQLIDEDPEVAVGPCRTGLLASCRQDGILAACPPPLPDVSGAWTFMGDETSNACPFAAPSSHLSTPILVTQDGASITGGTFGSYAIAGGDVGYQTWGFHTEAVCTTACFAVGFAAAQGAGAQQATITLSVGYNIGTGP